VGWNEEIASELPRVAASPELSKQRILRRCVIAASKSDGTRPTRPLCKLQDSASAQSYARAIAKRKGNVHRAIAVSSLSPTVRAPMGTERVCEASLDTNIQARCPQTSPEVSLRLPPANCLDPSGIRCPGRPSRATLLSSICKPHGLKKQLGRCTRTLDPP